MIHICTVLTAIVAAVISLVPFPPMQPKTADEYVRKGNRADTARATLASFKLPNLEGKWYIIGPFDNTDRVGFDFAYPPEKKVDLKATHEGKGGEKVAWKELRDFKPGQMIDFHKQLPGTKDYAVVYLYHAFDSPKAFTWPLSFGSDDTLSVFFNGKRVYHEPHIRGAAPDQDRVEVEVKEGKNELLVKICQEAGGWMGYVAPELPSLVPEAIRKRLDRDFPPVRTAAAIKPAPGEEKHYKIVTIPLEKDCVLEVGGLGFRPDGKLLACTRRGDVYLIHNPMSATLDDIRMTRFATGLHEALGLYVESNKVVYVVQRPELTRLIDEDGDGIADKYQTICDKWGVSGDYHEFAFGPARDKDGNFFIPLNVGFGGGHQAKAPWRGWCVKVSPDGKMEPFAYGLRSPNGINFSPEGDLFYCDNQGEWVVSNKMHHLKKGAFFGHQAGLRWVKDSAFAGKVPEKVASGMRYDGVDKSGKQTDGYPDLAPPCIWFPYGRMGKSVSEPIWDTTSGKFGPFAGQCFVGDQSNSIVMRVALEKVNGEYQGACFPFRSGFQCGVNRLCFAPDGSLFAGQTARGWSSAGGKPYGLQRLVYTGIEPFEIHHVSLKKNGFEFTFTKPVDVDSLGKQPVTVSSYTYIYEALYGGPEVDMRAEPTGPAKLSNDGKTLFVPVENLRKGRVYDFRIEGVKSRNGEAILHPEAYYTLNELVK